MRSVDEIINAYRYADDYHRYLISNRKRLEKIRKVFLENRKFFGKRVLDIGAGGALLGVVVKNYVDDYLGVDINPEVVNASKPFIEDEGIKLVLGDARTYKIPGKYDTVVMLGNVLGHLTVKQFLELLDNVNPIIERKAHFIINYRDWIRMYYEKVWNEVYKMDDGLSVTENVDTVTGEVEILKVRYDSGEFVRFTHAIWAPFIVEAIMNLYGWKIVKRMREPEWSGWFEVYARE